MLLTDILTILSGLLIAGGCFVQAARLPAAAELRPHYPGLIAAKALGSLALSWYLACVAQDGMLTVGFAVMSCLELLRHFMHYRSPGKLADSAAVRAPLLSSEELLALRAIRV